MILICSSQTSLTPEKELPGWNANWNRLASRCRVRDAESRPSQSTYLLKYNIIQTRFTLYTSVSTYLKIKKSRVLIYPSSKIRHQKCLEGREEIRFSSPNLHFIEILMYTLFRQITFWFWAAIGVTDSDAITAMCRIIF